MCVTACVLEKGDTLTKQSARKAGREQADLTGGTQHEGDAILLTMNVRQAELKGGQEDSTGRTEAKDERDRSKSDGT